VKRIIFFSCCWKATPTRAFNEFFYEFLRSFLISENSLKFANFFCWGNEFSIYDLEQSTAACHVCTITVCLPQPPPDTSLQALLSLTVPVIVTVLPETGQRHCRTHSSFSLLTYCFFLKSCIVICYNINTYLLTYLDDVLRIAVGFCAWFARFFRL